MGSLFFYAWGEPKYVILMVVEILVIYVAGVGIEKKRGTKAAQILTVAAVVFSFGILFYYKYADFFMLSFGRMTKTDITLRQIALPVGISFYTFQMISYVVDVYRRQVNAQNNPVTLGAYVVMFPQLIAGPIVRYADLQDEMKSPVITFSKIETGIFVFIKGLVKKVIFANCLGEIVEMGNTNSDQTVLFAWVFAVAVSLQLYYDFSGYSDMAIGLGAMLGFGFPKNFEHPFSSKSVTEFWRRWHITLGSWFRDYLYIPLGGNRGSFFKYCRNILIVFLATGLWHGAAEKFLLWGLVFGVLILLEKRFYLRCLEKSKILCHVYLVFVVLLTFILFEASDLQSAFLKIGRMFGIGGIRLLSAESLYCLKNYGVLLVAGILGSTGIVSSGIRKIVHLYEERTRRKDDVTFLKLLIALFLFLVVTAFLVNGSFNPFLYFRF